MFVICRIFAIIGEQMASNGINSLKDRIHNVLEKMNQGYSCASISPQRERIENQNL